MPHPIMFRDDDPGLAEVRDDRARLPGGVREDLARPAGVLRAEDVRDVRRQRRKATKGADTCRTRTRCWSRSTTATAERSSRTAGSSSPPTWGPSGWLGPGLHRRRRSTGTRSTELIDASYPVGRAEEADQAARRTLDRRAAGHGSIRGAMSFASPFPEVDIPIRQRLRLPVRPTSTTPTLDRVALIDAKSGRQTTYREMIARIDAFAGALADRGIGVGDVVGLLAPNSSAFAVAFHGILRAGATATTINALFTAKDIAKQLTDSERQDAHHGHPAAAPGERGGRGGRAGRRATSSCSTGRAVRPTGIPTPPTCSRPGLPAPEVSFAPSIASGGAARTARARPAIPRA